MSRSPLVVGLVHRQHALGEGSDDPGHPPAHARDFAVVLADGEGVGVLQHPIGQRLRRGGPDPADNGKADFHHRALMPELFQRSRRIAKIVLAGEVHARRHAGLRSSSAADMREALRQFQIAIGGARRREASIPRHDAPEFLQLRPPSLEERAQGFNSPWGSYDLPVRFDRALSAM
jgi:hypothetical protein